jgi:uncharacterized protein with von Willebrand factor type A (vWA) domain
MEDFMNENLKKLLRDVFSVDTKAGYRLRYHITRALACKDYAEAIRFDSGNGLMFAGLKSSAKRLLWLCLISSLQKKDPRRSLRGDYQSKCRAAFVHALSTQTDKRLRRTYE